MKKNKALLLVLILLLSISLTTILVSCNKTTNEHTHTWGKYSYVDESTHKRVCNDNILHEEISNHRFDDGKIITSPTDINPGTKQYECLDCGYKKLVSVAPTGNHVFNQEIVDDKYLKKFVTNQSAIYYKSCECGAYGNDDYLFENSSIPSEYTEVEYIQGTGKQFIDTGIKKSSSITTSFNTTQEDSTYNQNILTQSMFNNIQGEVVAISDKTMSTSGWGLRYNSQTSNEAISIASADQLSLESEAYYKLTFDACINTTEPLTQNLSAGIVLDRLTVDIKTCNSNPFNLSKTLRTFTWTFKYSCLSNSSLISLMFYADQKSTDELYVVAPIYITNISLEKTSSPCASSLLDNTITEEYQILEYIESTGTQWIDTGIQSVVGDVIVFDHTLTSGYMIGQNGSVGGDPFWQSSLNNTNGTIVATGGVSVTDVKDGNVHTITITQAPSGFDSTVGLFATNCNDTPYFGSGKVYSFKYYHNGILSMWLIPCVCKSDSVVGLYDVIENKFYSNKGTGTFIKGKAKSSYSTLPNNYEALTYIGTTGTQFIDTGYKPTNHTKVEMQLVSTESYGYWFGAWDESYNEKAFCFCNDGTGLYFGWDNNEAGTSGKIVSDGLHLICLDGNKAYVDGTLVKSVTDKEFSLSNSLHIFGQNRKGVNFIPSTYNQIKCAYVKIYENNVLMMHLISCFNKTTGEIGMYDIINNSFYKNNGAGTFVKGDITSSLNTDNSNVGILKGSLSSLYGYDFGKIYDYQIYENGNLIKSFVPVVKMSDSQTGLYELIEGKFYPSSTNIEFERGRVLMHDFDGGTIITKATYKDAGETVYKCSICGEELHYKVDPYSYKVTIENSNDYSIKIFKDYDYSSYETGNELYTRNLNTYNYSKVNNYVMFEVVTQKQIDNIKSSDLSVIIVNIKDNIYLIKGFSSNAEITINLLG